MRGICLLFFLSIFSIASSKTYYVSPNGNDNGSGSINDPWATWGHAFNTADISAGDTVYFRGGVYLMTINDLNWPYTPGRGYSVTADGVRGDTVRFWAYPGETPILDCDAVDPCAGYTYNDNYAIRADDVNYVHFKGLVIRNVWQKCGTSEVDGAFRLSNSKNVVIENCAVYNTGGIGFKTSVCDEVYFINCDSWNNCDCMTSVPEDNPQPGNDGSGFLDFNWTDSEYSVYYTGCRAWKCGDQGFSSGSIGYTEYDNCWSFNNGRVEGDGHGFKMGWINESPVTLKRYYHNCIAAFNRASGFTSNDQGYIAYEMHLYNNTAYHNGYYDEYPNPVYGFYIYNTISSSERELTRSLINNISYDNESGPIKLGTGAVCTNIYNSWNNPPGVNITDRDFVSLDSTGLSGPRQADGSLPNLNFLKLSSESSLIDAGTNVGIPYYGSAPDLGYSEYKSGNVVPANQPPAVSITYPVNNSSYSEPATITIQATASDPDGTISRVEFYRGSTRLAQISSPPYAYTWQNVEAGSYTLTAVAVDNSNVSSTSRAVNVVVNSTSTNPQTNSPPVVSISSPTKNSSYIAPATVTIETSASDSDGTIRKVEFFNGGTKIGERTSTPYNFVWKNVGVGTHSIHAVATDNDGAVTTSSSVQVYVNINQLPFITILSPDNNSSFIPPATILIEAEADDEDGKISKVEFYNEDIKLGESMVPPFFYIWKDVRQGNYSIRVVAIDDRNSVSTSETVNISVASDYNMLNAFKLYPNPNNGIFTISYNDPFEAEPSSIIITNSNGASIFNGHMLEGETTKQFDLSYLKPGIYIFTLLRKEIIATKRFIKQ